MSAPRPPQELEQPALREALVVALRAGELMLESGANTARVEATVVAVGQALGAERLHAYVTPTGIVATAATAHAHRTRIVRVLHAGLDLGRVAEVTALAERAAAGALSAPALAAALERVATRPRSYGAAATALAVGLACACFALLFGGGPREALASGVAAGVGQGARGLLVRVGAGRLATAALVAVVAASLAATATALLGAPAPGAALAASVLLLVPGALMVSAAADLVRGDTLSGLARATSAGLVVFAAGAGLALVLLAAGRGLVLSTATPPPLAPACALAALAAAGFGVLFDVPPRALGLGAAVGALAYGVRHALPLLVPVLPPEAALFAGGLTASLASGVLARRRGLPTSVITVPAFIPLVPGLLAFRAILELVAQDSAAGTTTLVRTVLLVAGLGAGIGAGNPRQRGLH